MSEPTAPPAPAPDAPTPAPAVWPAWVRFADVGVGLLVVAAAFLAAAFPARNADAFPHFAAGRLIAQGQYPFGTDPFAAEPGKPWANPSWLYDLGSYLVFQASPSGAAVVGLKAAAFAGLIGLILLFRRAGEAGWPYWLLAGLAVAAAAPHAGLRPLVGSGLLLVATLYVLFRLEWKPGSWRNPLILAGLFWLWAGLDGWFVLGPLLVLLTIIGEAVQGRGADATAPSLPRSDLLKALGLGVLACTLTPNHVHGWRLPAELAITFTAPAEVKADPLFAAVFRSPFAAAYLDSPQIGYNVGGFAFLGLLVVSLVLVFVGVVGFRMRAAYLLVWVLMALLAARQYRFILLFAAAAAPLAAMAGAVLAGRVRLGPADRPGTRLLLLGSGLGRVIGLAGGAFLAAVAFPGWLHPEPAGGAAYANRFALRVDADPALARTARRLHDWRTAGVLPEAYRGLHLSANLGDYLTWFAPAEKPFVTSRFAQHLDVLAAVARANRLSRPRTGEPIDPAELGQLMSTHRATHLVYALPASNPSDGPLGLVVDLTAPGSGFAAWHVDGYAVILGYLTAADGDAGTFTRLAFDPVALACDPTIEPLPAPDLPTPPPPREWLNEFLEPPPAAPSPAAMDALVWGALAQQAYGQHAQGVGLARLAVGGVVSGFVPSSPPSPPDHVVALKLLAVRAARRAVIDNPDDAEPYRVLAILHAPGGAAVDLPASPQEEATDVFLAAARTAIDRRPANTLSPPAAQQFMGFCQQLADAYRQPVPPFQAGLPDLAREMLVLQRKYLDRAAALAPDRKAVDQMGQRMDAGIKAADDDRAARYDRFAQVGKQVPDPATRGKIAALQAGLAEKAIDEYRAAAAADPVVDPELALVIAAVHLRAGRPAAAAEVLVGVAQQVQTGGPNPQAAAALRAFFQRLQTQLARAVGDYATAGRAMEQNPPPALNPAGRQVVATAVSSPEAWNAVLTGEANGALGGSFAGLLAAELSATNRLPTSVTVAVWLDAANFFLDRGRLLLLEGKIAEAKERFRQALRPDREGPELPAFAPQRAVAEQYLRMIEHAERGAGR